MLNRPISIQDPIHGTIDVSVQEIKLIDSRPFQRLRSIKQLGFSEYAFPGVTHSRYAHSLGAMHNATRMLETVLPHTDLPLAERERFTQMVRLAVLFHDLGHPPMSHVSESVMPNVSELALGVWEDTAQRQANHEDYTLKFLIHSELTDLVQKHFADQDITGQHLAALVAGKAPKDAQLDFKWAGKNYLPLLHQIVSSELDADRMDYLRRDAYYAGVTYGQFDQDWLVKNLVPVQHDDAFIGLGLKQRAIWAFENFLLARYHMFLTVYYHHTAICFDQLLKRFYKSGEYILPADIEAYAQTDDIDLWACLRRSSDPNARSIVSRQPYRLLIESHEDTADTTDVLIQKLNQNGIDYFISEKRAALSKYFSKHWLSPQSQSAAASKRYPLMMVSEQGGTQRNQAIHERTQLYTRFQTAQNLRRVFCHPSDYTHAKSLIAA